MNSIFFVVIFFEFLSFLILRTIFKSRYNYLKRILYKKNNRFKPDIFGFFWNNEEYLFHKKKIFNNEGYRSNYIKKKTNKILVLGDSTSEAIPYVKKNKNLWTSRLDSFVKKKKYQVINASLNCGSSIELTSHLLFKARYLDPKVIIFYAGINDLYPILDAGFKNDYSHSRNYNFSCLKFYNTFFRFYPWSIKLLFLFLTRKNNFSLINLYNFDEDKIDINKAIKKIKKNNFKILKNNLHLISNYCNYNKIKLILIPFCLNQFFLKKIKNKKMFKLSQNLIFKTFKECAKKNKHILINYEALSKNKDNFYDFLHFNEKGHLNFSHKIFNNINSIIN